MTLHGGFRMMFLAKRRAEVRHGRFVHRHGGRHSGSIRGFDRLLFREILLSICCVERLKHFMGNQWVPFEGFKALAKEFPAGVRKRGEEIARRAGRPSHYLAPTCFSSSEPRVRLAEKSRGNSFKQA